MSKPKVGIIIQARTGSTRFPNKVLAEFKGKPIIDHILENLAPLNYPMVVAIPDYSTNDPLYRHANRNKVNAHVYRSKLENDVLGRFKEVAESYHFDIIIRICADCPLIDADDVRYMLRKFFEEGASRMVWGLGCWIFTKEQLFDAANNSVHAADREHCGFHHMSKSVDYIDDIVRLENDG